MEESHLLEEAGGKLIVLEGRISESFSGRAVCA
jgi:hypothetical protein